MKKKSILIVILPVLLILFAGAMQKRNAEQSSAIAQSAAIEERITGNVVTLDPNGSNSYTTFAPELPATVGRVPQLDPKTGVYVEEAKPNLFYVTDGIYQSAFLKTEEGVIVFDAPPSFAHALPGVLQRYAVGEPIVYLVYSHGHTDHVGGTAVFADVPDLQVVAPVAVAESIAARGNPGILMPTLTYEDQYSFSLGGETV
ncbi:MAG: MBL fold metallo-hydrolase, partial [Chloroflexi bacterium]